MDKLGIKTKIGKGQYCYLTKEGLFRFRHRFELTSDVRIHIVVCPHINKPNRTARIQNIARMIGHKGFQVSMTPWNYKNNVPLIDNPEESVAHDVMLAEQTHVLLMLCFGQYSSAAPCCSLLPYRSLVTSMPTLIMGRVKMDENDENVALPKLGEITSESHSSIHYGYTQLATTGNPSTGYFDNSADVLKALKEFTKVANLVRFELDDEAETQPGLSMVPVW